MASRSARHALIALFVLVASGCETVQSDFGSFFESFSPPTPAQAARWASNTNDPEDQRRGIALLAGAPWGGAPPYVKLYRLYVTEPTDPLVKAFAIRALGRHGDAEDAVLIAKQLTNPSKQVRFEAAKALQRLHEPSVADTIWRRLVKEDEEDAEVRTELAIALGQYPTNPVFEALVFSLDQRELAVNWASLDSLQQLTGQDFGLDIDRWIQWRYKGGEFLTDERYLYPVYWRPKGFLDYLLFWVPLNFEEPGVPIGTPSSGPTRTYSGEPAVEDFAVPSSAGPEREEPPKSAEPSEETPPREPSS